VSNLPLPSLGALSLSAAVVNCTKYGIRTDNCRGSCASCLTVGIVVIVFFCSIAVNICECSCLLCVWSVSRVSVARRWEDVQGKFRS